MKNLAWCLLYLPGALILIVLQPIMKSINRLKAERYFELAFRLTGLIYCLILVFIIRSLR